MKKFISALLLAVLLLSGCASQNVQDAGDFAPPEEQRLVIYTSHKREVYEPIIREFEQRTGIWIELETGGTTALLERIAQGGTDCDLMFGGGVDSHGRSAKGEECFDTVHCVLVKSLRRDRMSAASAQILELFYFTRTLVELLPWRTM